MRPKITAGTTDNRKFSADRTVRLFMKMSKSELVARLMWHDCIARGFTPNLSQREYISVVTNLIEPKRIGLQS